MTKQKKNKALEKLPPLGVIGQDFGHTESWGRKQKSLIRSWGYNASGMEDLPFAPSWKWVSKIMRIYILGWIYVLVENVLWLEWQDLVILVYSRYTHIEADTSSSKDFYTLFQGSNPFKGFKPDFPFLADRIKKDF